MNQLLRTCQKSLIIGFVASFLVILPGCVTNLDSTVAPGIDLGDIKTAFVQRLPADNRGIEKLIAAELTRMGILAASGDQPMKSQSYDVLVTYQDKWMWDLTMYMIELKVQVLDPETRFVMASGNSFRTSLARRTPEEMVAEVLGEIFNEKQ